MSQWSIGQNHEKDLGSNAARVDYTLICMGVGGQLNSVHLWRRGN